VRHQQHRGFVRAPQRHHEAVHLDAGQRVECCERLVEQQQFRFADQRAGERHTLRFPTR
jgi:hypothetical protein